MTPKILIPHYAKNAVKNSLKLKIKFNKKSLKEARHILKKSHLSIIKAKEFNKFYQRFKNCRTKKCEIMLNLYGGRKFLKSKVFKFIKFINIINLKRKIKSE